MKKEDAGLDQLLAKGSLGGPKYDEIFEHVIARTEVQGGRARRSFWRWGWLAGAALAPAIVLLAIHSPRDPALRGKGPPVTAAVDIACGPSAAHVCRAGDVLVFTVNASAASGYLGAFAERLDDPAHDRIWYFSEPTKEPPLVQPGPGTVVVPQGIRIGPEHRPGWYRVTAWIASRPLARSQVDSAGPDLVRSRSTLDFEITP